MDATTDTSLTITRVFKTTPDQLWQILTDPQHVSAWHRLNQPGFNTLAEGDVRVGGAYKVSMTFDGGSNVTVGKYKELDPPKRMVYSWRFEADPKAHESEVTVELKPVDDGTELVLTHVRLDGPESVKAHVQGWYVCLDNINDLIVKEK